MPKLLTLTIPTTDATLPREIEQGVAEYADVRQSQRATRCARWPHRCTNWVRSSVSRARRTCRLIVTHHSSLVTARRWRAGNGRHSVGDTVY